MKQQLSDAQDENLDEMLDLGYSAKDYAKILQIYRSVYDSTTIEKKKDAFLDELMTRYKLSREKALEIYNIYK